MAACWRVLLAAAGLALSVAAPAKAGSDSHESHGPGYTNSLGMAFVAIPAGEFLMGNSRFDDAAFELPDGDTGLIRDELPVHRVRITGGFQLARTEVTQSQWLKLMRTRPGAAERWRQPDWRRLPVVSVTWHDARRFVAALNRHERTTAYRLPSEAEWEYAARAGSPESRPFPRDELELLAWFLTNSGDVPRPVASLQPNAWGLHDMLGNAWEWVADRYAGDYYAHAPEHDPPGPNSGSKRVRRGGSYHCQAHLVRVDYRAADTPDTRYSVVGFRVLREMPAIPDGFSAAARSGSH